LTGEERAALERQTYTLSVMRPVETRVTKGLPYSAEATTEFTQVLADGNRITRKTVTKIFRDSEGRTRREQMKQDGTGEPTTISIVDPAAGASFVLDPEKRTARRSAIAMARVAPSAPAVGRGGGGGRGGAVAPPSATPPTLPAGHDNVEQRRREIEAAAAAGMSARDASTEWRMSQELAAPGQATTESLGQQVVEGIIAEGKRTTTVITAGTIGNQQPIKIVSEQWFSPDLQVLVMTRHSDPRSGETIYRLVNLVRAEQDRSLFDVPPDYTVLEPGRRDQ
jgi:hypothetical protein